MPKQIPPNTLAACATLLQPHCPQASPQTLIEALQNLGQPGRRDPAERLALTINEAARALGTSVWTVRRRIQDGTLRASRLGGQYRVRPGDLDALLSGAEG